MSSGLEHVVVATGQKGLNNAVVAVVSLLFSSPDQMTGFNLEIGTADQLDAQSVAFLASLFQVASEGGWGRAEIGL